MATEKHETLLEDVQILNKINKRLDIIDETNTKLIDTQKDQKQQLINQKNNHKEETNQFKEECKEINKSLKELTKNIFDIGKQLKDKITKDELKYLNSEVDKWPLENFITKKELEKTYNHYHKNQ